MNSIRLTIIALTAVVLAACSGAQIDKAVKTLEGTYEPTSAELAEYSAFREAHPEYPDYSAGSSQVSEIIISSAQLESSSEPVSSEVVVAVVEPPVVVPEPVCVQTPWHGMNYSCDGKTSWPVE